MAGRFARIAGVAVVFAMATVLVFGQETASQTQNPPASEVVHQPGASPDAAGQAAQESTQPPDETAGAGGSPQQTPPPATAEQVLEEILRRRPQKPVVQPVDKPARVSQSGAAGPVWPDGWQLISRAGRLVHEGDDWLLALEGDHPDHPEPPIKLLPNLKLEAMVRETRAADVPPVYVVSGEVTLFFNENYLLVRMAMRRPDSGNLSK